MKTKLHFERLGIISGESKRLLEDYVDTRYFSQRKSYDEWVVDYDEIELSLDLKDLFILSERFEIRVGDGWIELEEVL
mgnify:CR=1 FL=1|tara:strand:- start:364 stop:597 length:234 start_codon:yes stop_codon:yes gene_type:complete